MEVVATTLFSSANGLNAIALWHYVKVFCWCEFFLTHLIMGLYYSRVCYKVLGVVDVTLNIFCVAT